MRRLLGAEFTTIVCGRSLNSCETTNTGKRLCVCMCVCVCVRVRVRERMTLSVLRVRDVIIEEKYKTAAGIPNLFVFIYTIFL